MKAETATKATLAGGAFAAIAASACCIGPLVLVTVGVGGAWLGNFAALEPYRPPLIVIAMAAMILAYRRIYARAAAPDACAPGTICAVPATRRMYKTLFWSVAAMVVAALAFPYFAPLFY